MCELMYALRMVEYIYASSFSRTFCSGQQLAQTFTEIILVKLKYHYQYSKYCKN